MAQLPPAVHPDLAPLLPLRQPLLLRLLRLPRPGPLPPRLLGQLSLSKSSLVDSLGLLALSVCSPCRGRYLEKVNKRARVSNRSEALGRLRSWNNKNFHKQYNSGERRQLTI